MKRIILISLCFSLLLSFFTASTQAQVPNLSKWTISEIMQEDFVGHSPRSLQWSPDSKTLFFYWRTGDENTDSPYVITPQNLSPEKTSSDALTALRPDRSEKSKDGQFQLEQSPKGLQLIHLKKNYTLTIFNTTQRINNPHFSHDGSLILFSIENDLFSWSVQSGSFRQLTNFQDAEAKRERPAREQKNEQDQWLEDQQKQLFPQLSQRGRRDFSGFSGFNQFNRMGGGSPSGPKPIYLNGFSQYGADLSPDNRFVTYLLNKGAEVSSQNTEMPVYVTSSGYTETQDTRSKVGNLPGQMKMGIYDLVRDSLYELDLSGLPGIFDAPAYYADYGREMRLEKPKPVYLSPIDWSADGRFGIMTAGSYDNKDRWIFKVNLESGTVTNLDHQHDDAWIGGPGIGFRGGTTWMPDQQHIWFQSEVTGYSHLYLLNAETGEKKALTSGEFEIYSPFLSKDRKYWYFSSNEVHPGERHFYKMPINGGVRTQLTSMPGNNSVVLSPDEKYLAILCSFANHPEELYLQQNKAGAEAIQITDGRSEKFRSYPWRMPEFITFYAQDGAQVYARLYLPEKPVNNKAAVIFVHGAGYLQNAHKWWSSYYHEYLFHNILADNGYTVLDIDYRGSAGYGRDWRTGIYRWMGGKDLSDHVDGAKWLVNNHGIDPAKIGIYGGSYGGFITLMAMFNAPDIFSAGAALRSVTDWAHYNHGYTADILNTPVEDSIAFVKSSPIYFAEGLQGSLLMCHGMLDDNVHFQDIVRLSQRLIDLGKENWELAVYPLERHSFTDPAAWTDEYRRIFKLFQTTIGSKQN